MIFRFSRRLAGKFVGLSVVSLSLLMSGCGEEQTETSESVVRGIKTVVVSASAKTTRRHFPSVVEPSDITRLAFEVGGQLGAVDLSVGQRVKAGDVLMAIDPKSLSLQVETSKAALQQAQSNARNAAEDFKRKDALLKKKVVTKAAYDQSKTTMETTAAQTKQAEQQLKIAQDNLSKSDLKAPFDGVISSVDAQSFTNAAPGTAVVGLYKDDAYEVSFSVPFDVINQIVVGKPVEVRLADEPTMVLKAHVKELGSRADQVSAFPVVVALDETHPLMKAGMAVEVTVELPVLGASEGFLLPLSVVSLDVFESQENAAGRPEEGAAEIFVFDEATSTVKKQRIKIAGIRESLLLVISGVKEGDRVASAGVSFLRDGQKVTLLEQQKS